MTALDDKLLPKVANLINVKVGVDVTFYVAGARATDMREGSVVGGRDVATTIKASPPVVEREANDDGSESRQATLLIAGQGLTFEPKKDMRVRFDSGSGVEEWKISERKPIKSGESVVAWKLVLN